MFAKDYLVDISNLFTNLKLIALKNRINPDFEAHLRYLYRQFSITFHTPLSEVEKLNPGYVLLHLYENDFFSKTDEDIRKIKHNLLNNLNKDLEQEDDDWINQIETEELKKEQELLDSKNKNKPPPDIEMKF